MMAVSRADLAMQSGFNVNLMMYCAKVLEKSLEPILDSMKSRTVRDEDIFLCSYPKAGNHWVWEMLNMIVAGKPEYARHWQNWSFFDHRSEEHLDTIPSPRIFKTHLTPSFLPDALWERKCKILYVQRNPKDVAVSNFVQRTNQKSNLMDCDKAAFSGSWDQWLELQMAGNVMYDSWFDHVTEWNQVIVDHPDTPYMKIHYEDLKTNCVEKIKEMADFIGYPLAETVCREIAEACQFENLKKASETIKDQTFHRKWNNGAPGYFRKGQVGDWKNWFTVAQNERFQQVYEEKMQEKCPY